MIDSIDLFTSGTKSYHTFRIPALITTPTGTTLAFCEGRKGSRSDSGDIDILLRRSEDGGQTWGEIQVVWDDGSHTCGNPCPVVDRDSGTISLLLTHNLGDDVERDIIARTSEGTRTVWLTSSEDQGRTWTTPVEITAACKDPTWTWYATGPGAGIQLASGRLVVPCDHIEADHRYFSHVLLSDDGGQSWRLGGTTPQDQVNECEVVELKDGRLLLNMRNYNRDIRARAISHSDDSGESWSPLSRDPILVEPICQASIRRIGDCLLFSNPASAESRENLTVRLSRDEGQTWPYAHTLNAGPAAYSCLAALPDGRAACLYECGEETAYERLTLARFTPEAIIDTL